MCQPEKNNRRFEAANRQKKAEQNPSSRVGTKPFKNMSLLVKPEHNKNNNNNKIHKWKRLHFITGKPNNLLF